jgi:hypothetical protein
MALRVEEVLSVWRDAERVLNDMPASAPERPSILRQVARLRRYHARLTTEIAPTSWRLLSSTHDAMTETQRLLGEARVVDAPPGTMDRTHRLMREWLLAEQELNRQATTGPVSCSPRTTPASATRPPRRDRAGPRGVTPAPLGQTRSLSGSAPVTRGNATGEAVDWEWRIDIAVPHAERCPPLRGSRDRSIGRLRPCANRPGDRDAACSRRSRVC